MVDGVSYWEARIESKNTGTYAPTRLVVDEIIHLIDGLLHGRRTKIYRRVYGHALHLLVTGTHFIQHTHDLTVGCACSGQETRQTEAIDGPIQPSITTKTKRTIGREGREGAVGKSSCGESSYGPFTSFRTL